MSLELEKEKNGFQVKTGRQTYLVQIEGTSKINGIGLETRNVMEIMERRKKHSGISRNF
ncbi:hypothetical protein EDD72_10242 [Tepidibacillus fermentans]|uniref:Uncharacterized protein n=1 Tax=Tepidibacillus fermentans TaxID=1281767 RepID=A0A4R3KKH1_9BACI|nr:hypothetical protein EDD72_10242 [Tepidibacillus fermentans]